MPDIIRRWAAVLALVPGALLGVLCWLQPRPPTVSAVDTLEDALFLSLTAVVILCAVGTLTAAWPLAGRTCLTGAVAGGLMGAMVLLAGFSTPSRGWVMLLAAFTTAASGLVALWMWRKLPGKRLPNGRDKVLAAALALSLPGIQAWHALAFTEATQKVSISITTAVETQGVIDATGAKKVRLSMNVENKGQTRALILVSLASYCWVDDRGNVGDDLFSMGRQPDCGWTRPIGEASWIDAGTVLSDSLALVAPSDKSRLIVGVRIVYARGDRLQTEPVIDGAHHSSDNGPCVHATYLPVLPESRVKSLARGQTYLMYADKNNDGGLNFWLATDTTCRPENNTPGREDFISHYAISNTTAWFQTWVRPEALSSN